MKTKLPYQVGITGGIGSGKSVVARIFKTLGVPVYDADQRAKELVNNDPVLMDQIKNEFGPLSYQAGGSLDREYMAKTVFADSTKLGILNRMVHPRVRVDYDRWLGQLLRAPYVIREAALIFEAGSWKDLDVVVMVSAPEAMRLKRVLARDRHRTAGDIRDIFGNQLPEDEKLKRADYVITNDESQLVIPQVLRLHDLFLKGN